MVSSNVLKILGSGTSTGIPMLGCSCEVCTSLNPKNKRLRTSFLIESKRGKNILIDTSPDLRAQLLREKIKHIDGAIITHDHADHLHGIDDLRPYTFTDGGHTIPVYTDDFHAKVLTKRFAYIFDKSYFNDAKPVLGGGIPRLSLETILTDGSVQKVCDEDFYFYLQPHGHGKTIAIIYEKLAILIDCHEVTEEVRNAIKTHGVETIIIDCVTDTPHKTHLNLQRCFQTLKEIAPKRAGLIHMGHSLEHEELQKKCQESFDFQVFPTYDMQHIEF